MFISSCSVAGTPLTWLWSRHHRPRIGVLDGDLERQQVEAEYPRVDPTVDRVPVGLGLVRDEVLEAGADPALLQTPDVRRRQPAGEERVLGVRLEQAPAQRRAVQVDRGAKHDVDALALGLLGQDPAYFAGSVLAPRGREARSRSEAGSPAPPPNSTPPTPVGPSENAIGASPIAGSP